jgi:surfeit locus 1 family protein
MTFRLPSPVLIALLLAAIAVLVALGAWQLQRNEWRNDLVAERNARLDDGHLAVGRIRAMPIDEVDFRLVDARGTWDHERTMLIANRVRFHSRGEEIVTPLLLEPGGPAVLVVRGWAPEELRDEVVARLAENASAEVAGLVRYHEGLSARLTPQGSWSGMAPEQMAERLPYEVLPWFIVEGDLIDPHAGPPEELPAQGFLPYESHVPHLEYAMTWFGIAAVLVAFAVIRFAVAPRRQRAREAALAERAEESEQREPAAVDR